MSALTDEQKRHNAASVISKAMAMIERNKAHAVTCGDITASIGTTSRQSDIEAYFRARYGMTWQEALKQTTHTNP